LAGWIVNQWEPPAGYLAAISSGNKAIADGNWSEAAGQYRTALEEAETGEAHEGIANAAWWLDEVATLFHHRERAFACYRDEGDPQGAARAAIWLSLDYHIFRNSSAIANGWMQRARSILLVLEPVRFEHCLLAFAQGHIALENYDFDALDRYSEEAVDLAREIGVFDLEMLSLALRGLGLVSTGDVDRGMSMLDESVAAATSGEVDDPDAVVTICCYLFYACERVRDFRRASEWCAILVDLCRKWDYRSMVAVCRSHYASVLIWQGEWEQAERELTDSTEELLSTRAGWAPEGLFRLANLRQLQGESDAASEIYRQIRDHPFAQLGQAELALEQDDLPGARDLVERFLRRIPARAVADRVSALDLLLQISIRLNDRETIDRTREELARTSELIETGPIRAVSVRANARVSSSVGSLDEARRWFEDAVDLFVGSNAVFDAARTRLELAESLAAGGRNQTALAECRSAVETFERIGAGPDLERARRLMSQLADDPAQGLPQDLQFPGLSKRESQILRLIALGCTNPDIADELFLSVRTVERHVSSIYQKLGAEGSAARAIATAYAFEHTPPE
jgi:LuxR family transcriptional regulator, maltose regulon positive regulatory protein